MNKYMTKLKIVLLFLALTSFASLSSLKAQRIAIVDITKVLEQMFPDSDTESTIRLVPEYLGPITIS